MIEVVPETRRRVCDRCRTDINHLPGAPPHSDWKRGLQFLMHTDATGRWDAGELDLCDGCAALFDAFMDGTAVSAFK